MKMITVWLISAGLAIFYLIVLLVASVELLVFANKVGPVILLCTCFFGAYYSIKSSPQAFVSPQPWFFFACAVYFGFGPLVYHFGTVQSVSYCDAFFRVGEVALLRTNLLNAVGIFVIVSGFILGKNIFKRKYSKCINVFNYIEVRRLMFFFLTTGLFVKYAFAFPYYMGFITWVLPGIIQHLATFTKIAIILLFILVHKGYGQYKWILYFLLIEEFGSAILTLSKLAIIEVFVAIGIGWYLTKHPTFRSLALSTVALCLFYVLVLSPFILFARFVAGSVGVGTLSEVSNTATGMYNDKQRDNFADILPGVQGWWTRVAYANAQAFAMTDYDKGKGGKTVSMIPYAFVPRLLFPEKPVMTPGREFTEIITGEETETATAAGFFAEAYWNGGWPLMFIISFIVALILSGFSIVAERFIVSGHYEYLPVIMIGITVGYSPCDWFVVTYIGPLVNAITIYMSMRYLVMPLVRHNSHIAIRTLSHS